ncbi:hypothetical protein [Corynebacterium sp. HMSC074H12]|uniref:hypothetical protein n=1 Tax=Corynebacterium sp. HMSC074H12 TaxID=1739436 RepID=UPI0008B0FC13|nr:hypothetical protein [Corynebacterium sp. HMSC074H12]OFQ58100.1 hypothetical protein HMPREF2932_07375 [Corynebacterium sp. HMSC074H12]
MRNEERDLLDALEMTDEECDLLDSLAAPGTVDEISDAELAAATAELAELGRMLPNQEEEQR